jgi:hypothetical protein
MRWWWLCIFRLSESLVETRPQTYEDLSEFTSKCRNGFRLDVSLVHTCSYQQFHKRAESTPFLTSWTLSLFSKKNEKFKNLVSTLKSWLATNFSFWYANTPGSMWCSSIYACSPVLFATVMVRSGRSGKLALGTGHYLWRGGGEERMGG